MYPYDDQEVKPTQKHCHAAAPSTQQTETMQNFLIRQGIVTPPPTQMLSPTNRFDPVLAAEFALLENFPTFTPSQFLPTTPVTLFSTPATPSDPDDTQTINPQESLWSSCQIL